MHLQVKFGKDHLNVRFISHALVCSFVQIVLLLRLVPLLPFNVLNYLLSVTPISNTTYIIATWFGVMVCPIMLFVNASSDSACDFQCKTWLGFCFER